MLDGVNCQVCEIDDHDLHVNEHIAFMLGEDFEKAKVKNNKLESLLLEHIKSHKKMKGEN